MAFSFQRSKSCFQDDEQTHQSINQEVNETFVYKLSLKDYILRLLILGSPENKYDPRKKGLSTENAEYIKTQIEKGHGEEICNIVRDVYKENRAPKQDATMMVIGLLCRAEDVTIRKMGLQLLVTLQDKRVRDLDEPSSAKSMTGFFPIVVSLKTLLIKSPSIWRVKDGL